MKKFFLPVFLLILALFVSNCGGGSSGTIPSATPTVSPVTDSTDNAIVNASDIAGVMESCGAAYLNYREEIGIGSGVEVSAVTVPDLPDSPPTVPSGTPVRTRSESYSMGEATVDIDIYFYLEGTILNPQTRGEWTETELYGTTPLSAAYGAISAPTPQATPSVETREFTMSRWVDDNALRVYTIGEGTQNRSDSDEASFTGTQVLVFPREIGDRSQLAYSFSCTKSSDGSMIGTLEFDNGTGAVARSAVDESAIGTTNQYAEISGTIDFTATPADPDVSFVNTVYGNGAMTLVKTFGDNVVATRTYNSDGSGSGLITGIANTTIILLWDDTGNGVATVTVGPVQTEFDIYVPRPNLAFIPGME